MQGRRRARQLRLLRGGGGATRAFFCAARCVLRALRSLFLPPRCRRAVGPLGLSQSAAASYSRANTIPHYNGRSAAAMAPLNPARLAKLLIAAVAALEREARGVGSGESGGRVAGVVVSAATLASLRALVELQLACQVTDGHTAPAAVRRVPLPSPSAEVDAALDGLARLIAAAASSSGASNTARRVGERALQAVSFTASAAPLRAAALARHGSLMRALAAALSVRRDALFLPKALGAALILLDAAHMSEADAAPAGWLAGQGGANLRAVAVALAGAFGDAREAFVGVELFDLDAAGLQDSVCRSLASAILACPEGGRLGFCASLLAQEGFTATLCACIARDAAAVLPPDAACAADAGRRVQVSRALALATALGGAIPNAQFDDALEVAFTAPLDAGPPPPSARPFAEQLLAAAPALLERVADVVAAGAPWYAAVRVMLRPAAPPGGAERAELVAGYVRNQIDLWEWAVALLRLMPTSALTSAAAGRGLAARLGPPLLGLAEAAQAIAGLIPGTGAELLTDELRSISAVLAASTMHILDQAAAALGGAACVLVDGAGLLAVASLVRLSALEMRLLADGVLQASEIAGRVFPPHQLVRLRAARVLTCVAGGSAWSSLAGWLAEAPSRLSSLCVAVGASPGECRFAPAGSAAEILVAERRALAAGLLERLATSAADGAGSDASWVVRLEPRACPALCMLSKRWTAAGDGSSLILPQLWVSCHASSASKLFYTNLYTTATPNQQQVPDVPRCL